MCKLFPQGSLLWKTWPEEGGDRAELLIKTGDLGQVGGGGPNAPESEAGESL